MDTGVCGCARNLPAMCSRTPQLAQAEELEPCRGGDGVMFWGMTMCAPGMALRI